MEPNPTLAALARKVVAANGFGHVVPLVVFHQLCTQSLSKPYKTFPKRIRRHNTTDEIGTASIALGLHQIIDLRFNVFVVFVCS